MVFNNTAVKCCVIMNGCMCALLDLTYEWQSYTEKGSWVSQSQTGKGFYVSRSKLRKDSRFPSPTCTPRKVLGFLLPY